MGCQQTGMQHKH